MCTLQTMLPSTKSHARLSINISKVCKSLANVWSMCGPVIYGSTIRIHIMHFILYYLVFINITKRLLFIGSDVSGRWICEKTDVFKPDSITKSVFFMTRLHLTQARPTVRLNLWEDILVSWFKLIKVSLCLLGKGRFCLLIASET